MGALGVGVGWGRGRIQLQALAHCTAGPPALTILLAPTSRQASLGLRGGAAPVLLGPPFPDRRASHGLGFGSPETETASRAKSLT